MRKAFTHFALGLAVLSAVVLAGPAGYASALACVPSPPRAIGWWPGDGNADDVVGSHHGALTGSAIFGAGKVEQAFTFNGSGGVDIPDDPAWTLGSHDFTIEMWAKFNSVTGTDPLIGHTDGSGLRNKWIFWFNTSGHDKLLNTPALRFMNYSATQPVPPHDIVVAPWNPATGQWYHLAVTRGGDTYRLYINGSQAAIDTSSAELPDPNVPLTIGKAEAFRLNGAVDEPALYSRALTAQEISDIANAGSAGKCKNATPVPEYGWSGGALALVAGIGAVAFARKRLALQKHFC